MAATGFWVSLARSVSLSAESSAKAANVMLKQTMIVTMACVLNGFNSFSMCGFAGCRNFLVVDLNRSGNVTANIVP